MRSILITGASDGIGAQIARHAAAAGYEVGLGYRSNEPAAQAVAAEITAQGRNVVLLKGDVAEPDAVARIFASHRDAFGAPSVVVNNAGVVPPRGRALADADPAEIARVVGVNVTGALYVAREAARAMSIAKGGTGGVLLNISSVAARTGSAGEYVDYAATKAAIDTMTLGLAHEHARDGIRVVGIRPGVIDTAIHAKGGAPDRAARLAHAIPAGRAGTVAEIADVAMFLISDAASYVTGSIIDVSGGR